MREKDRYIPVVIIFKHQRVSEEEATFKSKECWVITGPTAVIFSYIFIPAHMSIRQTVTINDTFSAHLLPKSSGLIHINPFRVAPMAMRNYTWGKEDRVTIRYDSPW